MKGMELSRLYYREVIQPFLHEEFSEYEDRIAAGLVGEGSECYGYDDEISRDHDWGAKVCLWFCQADYQAVGEELQGSWRDCRGAFAGIPLRGSAAAMAFWRSGISFKSICVLYAHRRRSENGL